MQVQKKEVLTSINAFEKLSKVIFNTKNGNVNELAHIASITFKLVVKIQPLFKGIHSFEKNTYSHF